MTIFTCSIHRVFSTKITEMTAHLQKLGGMHKEESLSLAIIFHDSFNFVEIAFISFVCKHVSIHSLTRNFQP